MALFLEDSQKVTNRKIPIPKNAQKIFSALYNALEPNMGKNQLKNLKNLATDKTYNKKGENSKTNGKDANVNYVDVEVAKKRMQRWPQNQLQQMAQGGQLAYDTYKKGVERARSQEKVQAVEPPKPTSDADIKPSDVKLKKMEMPSGTITYNENRVIKESDGWHELYDYMEEYDAYYVLSEFFNNPQGKQDWGVLINPEMYVKALRELSRFGKLTNSMFPSKYVYQWMGIIMKNTLILQANTDLAGHSMNFPSDDVIEFASRKGVQLSSDYYECSEWLDECGLYNWMKMPDGSDAWSDYGLDPLYEIIKEYDEELPPEKVLVLVNRALDIGHCRGDLASIFIQGGSQVLTKISEEINKNNKKVYITEEQLINLKNG